MSENKQEELPNSTAELTKETLESTTAALTHEVTLPVNPPGIGTWTGFNFYDLR